MANRKQPLTLKLLCTTESGKSISTNVRFHLTSEACDYCINPVPDLNCETLSKIRSCHETIPCDALALVKEELDRLASEHMPFTANLEEKVKRQKLLYTMYLALGHEACCSIPNYYITNIDDCILKKSGKFMKKISFKSSEPEFRDVTINEGWYQLFSSVCNVQFIDFYGVPTTGNLLKALGKECCLLKGFESVCFLDTITKDDILQFCFGDDGKKNNCCNTLEVIDIYQRLQPIWNSETSTCEKWVVKALAGNHPLLHDILQVLLDNLTNLKRFERCFTADKYIARFEKCESIPATSLTTILCYEWNDRINRRFQQAFPKCRILKLVCRNTESIPYLKTLIQLNELQTLEVNIDVGLTDDTLYQEILHTVWPNLKSLHLDSIRTLNIKVFAHSLKNLETLNVRTECIKWDGKACFKALEEIDVHISRERFDCDWFKSFSTTITNILVGSHWMLTTDLANVLTTHSFPNLKKLSVDFLPFDKCFIELVLENCSKLECIGAFSCSNRNNIEPEIGKYREELKIQNYDVELLLKHTFTVFHE